MKFVFGRTGTEPGAGLSVAQTFQAQVTWPEFGERPELEQL
jgi:hypothetical protein